MGVARYHRDERGGGVCMLDIEAIRRATALLRGVAAAAGPGAWDGAPEEDVVDALGAAAELSRACDALRVSSAGALARRSEPLLPSESLARRLGHAGSRKLLMELFGVGSYAAQSWVDVAAAIQPRRGLSSGELPPLRPAVARAIGAAEISAEVAKAIVEHLAKLTGESVVGGTDVAEAALVANATGGRINLFAPVAAAPARPEAPHAPDGHGHGPFGGLPPRGDAESGQHSGPASPGPWDTTSAGRGGDPATPGGLPRPVPPWGSHAPGVSGPAGGGEHGPEAHGGLTGAPPDPREAAGRAWFGHQTPQPTPGPAWTGNPTAAGELWSPGTGSPGTDVPGGPAGPASPAPWVPGPDARGGFAGASSGPEPTSPGTPGPYRPVLPPSMDESAAKRGIGSALSGGRLGLDRIKEESKAWWLVLDPDGAEPNYERQRKNRSFRVVHRRDGGFDLSGFAPEVEGQAIKTVLDAWLSPRGRQAAPDALFGPDSPFAAPGAAADHAAGAGGSDDNGDGATDPVASDPAPRTRDQRAFDALAHILALHAASADAPSTGGGAPTLLVSTTLTALDEHLRDCTQHEDGHQHDANVPKANTSEVGWWPSGLEHLPLDANGLPDPHALIDLRFARVGGDGTPVPLSAVLHLLCDAALQVMLTDPTGVPLKLGRARRLFSKDQRRVLAARDHHCRAPGCDIPAPWCEVHHVVPWQDGGRTDVSNAILLCSFHHHEIDRGRLRVTHHPGRGVPFGQRYGVEATWAPRGGQHFRPTG